MNKEIIYSMNTAYRGEYEIQGFSYGSGDKAACIVGAMRGNEFQQLYISSLLAKKLGELEARGAIVSGKKILLIPSINYSSFNVGKKYWITDNSDINRSFPGSIRWILLKISPNVTAAMVMPFTTTNSVSSCIYPNGCCSFDGRYKSGIRNTDGSSIKNSTPS